MSADVALCVHPDCKRDQGKPQRTELGVCEPCQWRVRQRLLNITADWVLIHTNLPSPLAGDRIRGAKVKDYGHPAMWASETARTISISINDTHDALAEARGETPPPPPTASEHTRVRAGWNYLSTRIDKLSKTDFARDTIDEWNTLHHTVRRHLGQTRPRIHVAGPCPQCSLRTLTHCIDIRRDWIECGNCQFTFDSQHYQFYSRVIIDAVLRNDDESAADQERTA